MSGRRRYPLSGGSNRDGEHEALLGMETNNGFPTNFNSNNTNCIPSHLNASLNSREFANNNPIGIPPPVSGYNPLLVQRKARDKSPETLSNAMPATRYQNQAVTQGYHYQTSGLNSTSQAQTPYNRFQHNNETYELAASNLQISSSSRQSRAVDIFTGGRSGLDRIDFIYYDVQPGDTLHNISMKYSCPIASIKRLNGLWSDQEFYGLSRLKLPVGKLRLLEDALSEQEAHLRQSNHARTSQSGTGQQVCMDSCSPPDLLSQSFDNNLDNNNVAVYDNTCADSHGSDEMTTNTTTNAMSPDCESIFKDYDLSIEKARTAALSYSDHASDIMQSLGLTGNIVGGDEDDADLRNDPNKLARREAETLLNDLSDYGLSYNGLILFIFIVCLICPLAYVIYMEETHHYAELNKHHD